jgi:cyclohexanone monooxygenase
MGQPVTPSPRDVDVLVVGAGFAGLYAIHLLRSKGLAVVGLEAAPDVGGTWYWNRYPGARCDVVSTEYCYSFDPVIEREWRWTEKYAAQPEILAYLRFVADRLDLRRSFEFNTKVTSARWENDRWRVTAEDGRQWLARYCIMAVGNLSLPRVPDFAGLSDFQGETYHTGLWPEVEPDFTDKHVGVIGTGSSGIQVIPILAERARELTVFQRTAHYALPAFNRPISDDEDAVTKANYADIRHRARYSRVGVSVYPDPTQSALEVSDAERKAAYDAAWESGGTLLTRLYTDLLTNRTANETAASYVRERVRSRIADPKLAELLVPKDYPIAAKRVCLETDYYETFNRPTVHLVDVKSDPIERLTRSGVKTANAEYPLDAIVFATGYDAITGALLAIDITGEKGQSLRDAWQAGPRAYLGLAVAGFPNLFTVTGPGSPSVLSNMVTSIEQHVEWIAALLDHMGRNGWQKVEAEVAAQDAWVERVNSLVEGTLYLEGQSWYMGANVPGKPRVFMPFAGGVGAYRRICEEIVADGYRGFAFA